MVRAARQIDWASAGKVSNSFKAARIHETGRVFLVTFSPPALVAPIDMLSYLTTDVNREGVVVRALRTKEWRFGSPGSPYGSLLESR
jgi:hypothetical protein